MRKSLLGIALAAGAALALSACTALDYVDPVETNQFLLRREFMEMGQEDFNPLRGNSWYNVYDPKELEKHSIGGFLLTMDNGNAVSVMGDALADYTHSELTMEGDLGEYMLLVKTVLGITSREHGDAHPELEQGLTRAEQALGQHPFTSLTLVRDRDTAPEQNVILDGDIPVRLFFGKEGFWMMRLSIPAEQSAPCPEMTDELIFRYSPRYVADGTGGHISFIWRGNCPTRSDSQGIDDFLSVKPLELPALHQKITDDLYEISQNNKGRPMSISQYERQLETILKDSPPVGQPEDLAARTISSAGRALKELPMKISLTYNHFGTPWTYEVEGLHAPVHYDTGEYLAWGLLYETSPDGSKEKIGRFSARVTVRETTQEKLVPVDCVSEYEGRGLWHDNVVFMDRTCGREGPLDEHLAPSYKDFDRRVLLVDSLTNVLHDGAIGALYRAHGLQEKGVKPMVDTPPF